MVRLCEGEILLRRQNYLLVLRRIIRKWEGLEAFLVGT